MTDFKKLQGLRGMSDLLSEETLIWQEIERTAQMHFKRSQIKEIRTPLLESTELFSRGIGEATDVVGKEMYSFSDKGGRSCTLRPEGTASVVRAAIQYGLIEQGSHKFWYQGPMFRYERPQAGRQRQFHQLGIEFLGFNDPRSDVEAISIAWDLLNELQVEELTLEINTLGDSNDRKIYREVLIKWLEENKDKLDPDSQKRILINPLRILDSKSPSTKELLVNAPKLEEFLSKESEERFNQVQSVLKELGIKFKLNPCLVRGLDYYTHTAFEITSNQLGAQSTICGGGRYDGLVEKLGGSSTPAIGWAIGLERLAILLSKRELAVDENTKKIYVVSKGCKAESYGLMIARKLRLLNHSVELDLSSSSFGKQLKRANKSGAFWAIIVGDDEANNGKAIIKNLRTKSPSEIKEETISLEMLFQRFT